MVLKSVQQGRITTTQEENEMTTLTELEALAKAAEQKGREVEKHLGYDGSRSGSYVASIRNDTILALIALCRQQHEACHVYKNVDMRKGHAMIIKALAAFEQFGKE